MNTQWGAPLTGAQMKLLRAAGLPDDTLLKFMGWDVYADDCEFDSHKSYSLPADHTAYTLAKAGWLDGRNVALWFGGEKAPDDWDERDVLLGNGSILKAYGSPSVFWGHRALHKRANIIAYTRKAEGMTTHADRLLADADTVTIAKMTEAEAAEWLRENGWFGGGGNLNLLKILGIVKPEPTRLERFWSTRDTKDVYGPPCKAFQLIEEALNFERD